MQLISGRRWLLPSCLLLASLYQLTLTHTVATTFLDTLTTGAFHSLDIVKTYAHDPTHFTQGFAIDNTPSAMKGVIELYEGTGIWGGTYLHKYTLPLSSSSKSTFQLQSSFKLPKAIFGEGICVIGENILQLTWQNNEWFQFKKTAFTNSGTQTTVTPKLAKKAQDYQTFTYPVSSGGVSTFKEGWGMTLNTQSNLLYISDGSSKLFLVKPTELSKVVKVIQVHYVNSRGVKVFIDNLNELEYIPHPQSTSENDRGEIFANYYESFCILRIHPTTGLIVGVLEADEMKFYNPLKSRHSSVEAMNGVAFHTSSQRLFVTGKLWTQIHEVEAIPRTDVTTKAGSWTLDLKQYCPRLTMSVTDMSYWQQVLADQAQRGQAADKAGGHTEMNQAADALNSERAWSPVPPHSTAGKTLIAVKEATGKVKSANHAAAILKKSSHSYSDISHAELSSETHAVLLDSLDRATLLGHDDAKSQFDLSSYVELEMEQMSREAEHEFQHEYSQQHQQELAVDENSRSMFSGDLE